MAANESSDVLVLGAGVAGIICARVLSSAGLSVRILEARDIAGGRAWSFDALHLGVDMDLGATWIHCNCVGNPLLHLAKVRGAETRDAPDGKSFLLNVQRGKTCDNRALREPSSAVWKAIEKVKQRYGGSNNESDDSLLNALDAVGCSLQQDKSTECKTNKGRKHGTDITLLRWAFKQQISLDEGSDLEDLSARHWDDGMELPGYNSIPVVSMGRFVQDLIDGPLDSQLGEQTTDELTPSTLDICYNHVVQKVSWNSTVVEAQTADGTTFKASRAVVALPLGVLKNGSVSFAPQLPASKEAAMHRLGVASMTKVLLRFQQRFWCSKDCNDFSVCGLQCTKHACDRDSEQQENVESYFENAEFGVYDGFLPEGALKPDEGVLYILVVGRSARALELLSDDEVATASISVLRRAARQCKNSESVFAKNVSDPSHVAVSRWVIDPFSNGCWVTLPPGSSGCDCQTLAEPVGDGRRLSFAGEATTLEDQGTVHGALLTGVREAEAILMEFLSEGHFANRHNLTRVVKWMLWCREMCGRASGLRDQNECESSSSESDSD